MLQPSIDRSRKAAANREGSEEMRRSAKSASDEHGAQARTCRVGHANRNEPDTVGRKAFQKVKPVSLSGFASEEDIVGV